MFVRFDGRWLVVAILTVAALSGCLSGDPAASGDGSGDADAGGAGPGGDEASEDAPSDATVQDRTQTPDVPDYDFANAIEVTHAHDARDLHMNSVGFTLVGYSDLLEGLRSDTTNSGYTEVHVNGDLAVVAGMEGMRAYTLVDLSNLSNPTPFHHFYSGNDNWDVRLSEDNNYVFVGCQGTGQYTLSPVGDCTDYEGQPSTRGEEDNGIVTVDISDRRNPKALCYTPSSAVHNLETVTMHNGTILVANSIIELFYMKDDGCLEYITRVNGTHDVSMQYHPITEDLLLYTGYSALSVYDINDPWNPLDIGTLETQDTPGATAWHEQTPSPALINGRHILIGGGEDSTGVPGNMSVIDTTDPTTPTLLGMWTIPVEPPGGDRTAFRQGSYMFSTHNAEVSVTGQVCIGHYHAGVWVFDVSTDERAAAPPTIAFYQPHESPPPSTPQFHPAAGAFTAAPYVWGCDFTADGRHVIVGDMNTGIYVLRADWLQ